MLHTGMQRLRAELPVDVDVSEVYDVFLAVLERLPMSKTELAEGIGVSQPAVSRWASGDARPTLENMLRAVEVISGRISDLQTRTEHARAVLEAVSESVGLRERYSDQLDAEMMIEVAAAEDRLREALALGASPGGILP